MAQRTLLVGLMVLAVVSQAAAGPILANAIEKIADKVASLAKAKKQEYPCVLCLPQVGPKYAQPGVVCPVQNAYVSNAGGKTWCYAKQCSSVCDSYGAYCKQKCQAVPVCPPTYTCPSGCKFDASQGLCNCGKAPLPCPKGYTQCDHCPPGAPAGCPYSCISKWCGDQCPQAPKPQYVVYQPAVKVTYAPVTKPVVAYAPVKPAPKVSYNPAPATGNVAYASATASAKAVGRKLSSYAAPVKPTYVAPAPVKQVYVAPTPVKQSYAPAKPQIGYCQA